MPNTATTSEELFPFEIDFVDSAPSEAASYEIVRHLEKLRRLHDRIVSAHITVRIPNKHHHRKHFYHIMVKLTLPGHVIVCNRETGRDFSHTDIKVAIHDAFEKVAKQLDGFVKHRRERPHPVAGLERGKVLRFDPNTGFGFVINQEGHEIYFDENCLIEGNKKDIRSGAEVRIHTEMGQNGPQVTTMHLAGTAKL